MTVSILLPIYNRAHTLPRCLAGIQAQTFADWEVIAVDDGSQDGSAELIERLSDPRFRLLRHAVNRGAAAARNTALAAAAGEWVALLDSDDEWLPRKLELQLATLAASGADGCGCEYWLVEEGRAAHIRLPTPLSWAEELQTRCALGNGTTLLARRTSLEAIGPLDESLRLYEDWDWMLRFTRRFRYTVVEEPLARVHASGPRDPHLFATSAERFLANHAAEFSRRNAAHGAQIRSQHYEYVATNALAQREFALGCRYLWKALSTASLRRPALWGALLLAPLDAVLGTSYLRRLAGW